MGKEIDFPQLEIEMRSTRPQIALEWHSCMNIMPTSPLPPVDRFCGRARNSRRSKGQFPQKPG
ncbi:hypothetical protein SAMN05216404_1247 [Nitrosospira multiformis]|uniref:Uncharacterized protein n=1 Tax=Nitrosospira multiformis TaxID=1231 RepID=A0A1H8PY99_9PROT|nr:hypothetical protein SAMN05216404_1247 [Nitrosospira multiformis]